jgi:ferredoxin-nitrite reductase
MKWAQNPDKLNNVEKIKLAQDGLEVFQRIDKYAQEGFSAITEADFDRFKWYGLYVQSPKTDGLFMLRVKLPGGIIRTGQATALANIAHKYGRGRLDITTRQSVQFHSLTIENLPAIFASLNAAGLSTVEAAGDCPRNIVASPLAGLDSREIIDIRPLVAQVNSFFEGNRDFSNLPRKFKISISASPENSAHAEINDLSFVPAVRTNNGQKVVGFNVLVGGGLSARPMLAKQLNIFVMPDKVLNVAIAAMTLFRDYGYREKRHEARLKLLVNDWGVEKFIAELLKITGPLPTKGTEVIDEWSGGYCFGVQRQKQPKLNSIGLSIPQGMLMAEDLAGLAQLASEYGDGSLRTVNSQNLVIANIPAEKIASLEKEDLIAKFWPQAAKVSTYAVSCTGKQFCPIGAVETKERVETIARFIDRNVALDERVTLHVSGCINSCGQHQIADIGLQGAVIRQGDVLQEAFEIWIGGKLGVEARLGTKLKGIVPADDVARLLVNILAFYQAERLAQESFAAFAKRLGPQVFQPIVDEYLAG